MMNAHAKRFHLTIQEEYIDYHEDELLDPEQFGVLKADRGLMQHLLWHNTERPHGSLKIKPPGKFFMTTFLTQSAHMYVQIQGMSRLFRNVT